MTKTKLLISLLALAGGFALAPVLAAQGAPVAPTAGTAAPELAPPPETPKAPSLHRQLHDRLHDKLRAAVKVDVDKQSTQVEIEATDDAGRHAGHGNAVVTIGHDANLAQGESADAVVAILGNATSAGTVAQAVVSLLGNTRVTGPVGDAVVAVLGNTYVDSAVKGNVVAVMGDVELGPNAVVEGEVSTVGGAFKRDPAAQVKGSVDTVTMFADAGSLVGLHAWVHRALLYGRPLAIGPGLGWAWTIAGVFLALYLLMALLFHRGMERCVRTMDELPGRTVLASLLTLLLKPIIFMLVFVTVIGIILVPFLAIGLWIMGLFGKAVALAWLGHRLLPRNQSPEARHTVLAVLTGGVIITALYLVPVLGFVVYKGFDILGFGIVAYTLLQVWRATRAESAPPPAATAAAGAAPAAPRITPDAASQYPRAGFWLRMAALLIDLILVGVVCRILHVPANGSLLVILAGYGAIMWKLRGATVGSIVCNLRVVREDGRELDWPTVVVRALGCFLSFVVAGLGFLWIVFDGQRQGWHDKIAGTVVVRVPKPRPLV